MCLTNLFASVRPPVTHQLICHGKTETLCKSRHCIAPEASCIYPPLHIIKQYGTKIQECSVKTPYDTVNLMFCFSSLSPFFLNFSWMLFPTFQRTEEKSVVCSANWKKALCAFSAAVLLKFRVLRLELLLLNTSLVQTSRAAHAELLGFICTVHSPQPTRHIVCLSPSMIHTLQQRGA